MKNEELVAAIQGGERDKLPELWEQVERFVRKQANDPLHDAVSMDQPAKEDDTDGATLGELQMDPAAEYAIEAVEERDQDATAHRAALRALRHPSRSRALLAYRYWQN